MSQTEHPARNASGTDSDEVRRVVAALWRIESARLVAALARVTGDIGTAEDLAQDALVAALEQWPRTGIPPNPAGWLMTSARNRGVDQHRRSTTAARKLATLGRDVQVAQDEDHAAAWADAVDDHVDDDVLRLVFTACHPVVPLDGRVALTLKCVAGLSTAELARAFLVPEATMGQRIVRAKKLLRENDIALELPTRQESVTRLASVLEVIYLVFNEGYSATAGADWTRPDLCHEALRLGRLLVALAPTEPEVHGLLSLMEIQTSRLPARTTAAGEPILLADQDRRRWDRLLVRRGLEQLQLAQDSGGPLGPYTLQAAIAACHARAPSFETTDWAAVTGLYERLGAIWPNPVVELNRAVAVGMATGPAAGLEIADGLAAAGELAGYPLLAAVRGDLLERLGRREEARAEFDRAATLTRNRGEQVLFSRRARR